MLEKAGFALLVVTIIQRALAYSGVCVTTWSIINFVAINIRNTLFDDVHISQNTRYIQL